MSVQVRAYAIAALAPEFFSGTIVDREAAEATCRRLSATMADLLAVVERETDLVQTPRLLHLGLH